MKLVRDKIPEVIYFNGEIACVHIADDKEYSGLLRQKLREEVDEYLESGATEELADILEVLYALAAVLGLSENSLEELRLEKADARGRFLRRIVWHGSRPRLAQPSQAVADLTLDAPAARLAASAQPMHDLSLFDSSQVVRPIAVVRDGKHRRRRSLPSTSARGAGEVDPIGTQLQLSLEVSSR